MDKSNRSVNAGATGCSLRRQAPCQVLGVQCEQLLFRSCGVDAAGAQGRGSGGRSMGRSGQCLQAQGKGDFSAVEAKVESRAGARRSVGAGAGRAWEPRAAAWILSAFSHWRIFSSGGTWSKSAWKLPSGCSVEDWQEGRCHGSLATGLRLGPRRRRQGCQRF